MTDQIRTLLADLADEACPYPDPERAIGAARRYRRRRFVVVSAVVAVLVAAGAALPLLRSRPVPPGPPIEPGYPATVTPPAQPDKLPSGAVGPADFVYAPCPRDCAALVVLADGRQYALPTPDRADPVGGVTMSPNGAWLGWRDGGRVILRNLVTGNSYPVDAATDPWYWSPDSRWLLVADQHGINVDDLVLLDVGHGGSQRRVPARRCDAVVGVTDDGDILRWVSGGDVPGLLPVLGFCDPATGDMRREVRVTLPPEAGALLDPGETVNARVAYLGPGDETAILFVTDLRRAEYAAAIALLEVDLGDGHVVNRLDLPVPEVPDGSSGLWAPAAYLPRGVVLLHGLPQRTEIALLDPVTGTRTVVSVVRPHSSVIPPGKTRS
jgi:hypothetical protein